MISVSEAFSILEKVDFKLTETELPLLKASGHILAETIFSPIHMPPFRQSNMDGFALALHEKLTYEIVGEIKAGDFQMISLQPGQAVKIFTGAAVPDSAQAVIQIEKVTVDGNQLQLQETVLPETNVRPLGSQIRQNDPALEKGTLLNPAATGFLAALGFTSVKVYKKPSVGILVTGNELVQPGENLEHGQVYESNAIMLRSVLSERNFHEVQVYVAMDDLAQTQSTIKSAIEIHDLVIVSGGISVGDYDFVGKALKNLQVETLFYKVSQKPGKPLLVGKIQDKMIFALPGNPAASLTCFYLYVLPTLQKMFGRNVGYADTVVKKLTHDFKGDNPRDQFLKAIVESEKVTVLPHQDSSNLNSFALANALVHVPGGKYALQKGAAVAVYPL